MCGIVGYIGPRAAQPFLIEGLKRLEYRGYDSAGVAMVNGKGMQIRKAAGKIAQLEKAIEKEPISGTIGIAHTRWATHGAPNYVNAHPQMSCDGNIAVVHNGIIENGMALRKALEDLGHKFTSDTDTEVLSHLVEEFLKPADGHKISLEEAVIEALRKVEGTYGIAVLERERPEQDRRRAKGFSALGRPRRRRVLRRVRCQRHPRAHAPGHLPQRRRPRRARAPRLPRDGHERRAAQSRGEFHRLGPRPDRARRLRALHAQGDLRAAGEHREHHARPHPRRRGRREARRSQPHRRAAARVRQHHDHRLRHELALGAHRRVHARGAGADPGGGRVRVASSATGIRSSPSARCAS